MMRTKSLAQNQLFLLAGRYVHNALKRIDREISAWSGLADMPIHQVKLLQKSNQTDFDL